MAKDTSKRNMSDTISRQALGRIAKLGDLYDAVTEKFCGVSIFRQQLPPDCTAISRTDNPQSNISYNIARSLKEKCKNLDISGELLLSIFAGLVKFDGSAQYLSKEKISFKSVACTIVCSIKTVTECIRFSHDQVQDYILKEPTRYLGATHVVSGIEWGGSCVIAVTDKNKENKKKEEVEVNLDLKIGILKQFCAKGKAQHMQDEIDDLQKFSLEIFGDILPESSEEFPHTLSEALAMVRRVPQMVQKYNGGKGKPLTYVMIPLSYIIAPDGGSPSRLAITSVDDIQAMQVLHLLDHITELKQKVHDLAGEVNDYRDRMPSHELEEARLLENHLEVHQARVKREFAKRLEKIRSEGEDEGCFDAFCDQHRKTANEIFCRCNEVYQVIQARILFLQCCENYGAKYLASPVDQRIASMCEDHDNIYVLFHGRADRETTMKNESAFIELAKKNKDDSKTVCYFTWPEENGDVTIRHYRKGKLIHSNVAKQLETKNMAMCTPAARQSLCLIPFKFPCPGSFDGCCSKEELTWSCNNCNEPLQFCPNDRELYCSCGHVPANSFRFQCCSEVHGTDFKQFSNEQQLLSALDHHASLTYKGSAPDCPPCLGHQPLRSYYFIRSRLNRLVLDVEGENHNPGTRVITWNQKPGNCDNQLWYDDFATGTIRSKLNDFCIDCDGSTIVLNPYKPHNPKQQWKRDVPFIRNKETPNKVLDIAGNKSSRGTHLLSYDRHGDYNQCFDIEFVNVPQPSLTPRRHFYIVSNMHYKVLDIRGDSAAPGTRVIMWPKKVRGDHRNQLWYFDESENIRSANNDFALTAGNKEEKVYMMPFTNQPDQLWRLVGNRIMKKNSSECLDICGESRRDDANVISYQYKGSANQHWHLEYD